MAMCPNFTLEEALVVVAGETCFDEDHNNQNEGTDEDVKEAAFAAELAERQSMRGSDRKLSMDSTFHFLDSDNSFRGPQLITFDGKILSINNYNFFLIFYFFL